MGRTRAAWWQSAVIYQIYPRSFQDSDGDGVGDLAGILRRLDYLAWLGVDAIWLSPIYPSPMADFGYDVADFTAVDPLFGSLADFDALVAAAHGRGIRVILDYVPNHSSDRHPWFQESRSARQSPKRDWYIWRDPAPAESETPGGPPNNWLSEFGGPAWTYDPGTGQYYLHSYLKEQPDLNWRNPGLKAAMENVLRFWLDRGADGFRLDALHHVIKDKLFRDNPANPNFRPGMAPHHVLERLYTVDRPEVHTVIADLRRILDGYGERVLIGEVHLPMEKVMRYYGVGGGGVQLPFNFSLLRASWTAASLRPLIAAYEAALPPGAWPNWVLGNHDTPRIASRTGPALARLAALLLLTLRGTPTIYYGDELGMADIAIPPELVQDPLEKNLPGLGLGRDPGRTPMRWSAAPGAGFTSGTPWLPLGGDLASCNVAAEAEDPGSMLSLYRRLIALRKVEPALAQGSYTGVETDPRCLGFIREAGPDRLLVLLNFADAPCRVSGKGRLLLSSDPGREIQAKIDGAIELAPAEGVILKLA
jgi:alpha-glucosidase